MKSGTNLRYISCRLENANAILVQFTLDAMLALCEQLYLDFYLGLCMRDFSIVKEMTSQILAM